MIALTKTAAKKVKEILAAKDATHLGIRPGVRGGGCSGFTYYLDLVTEITKNEKDRLIESNGVRLYVDPKSFLYLMGTEIDYIDELNQAGFKFTNPNAKRTCGCGESFSV